MDHLVELNRRFGEVIYGMPIIEDSRVAFKETRLEELLGIKRIVDANKDLILNIRVGGTDFSSCFGVRRGINYTIYDIMTVRDCLLDILNVFTRNNDYTVSGPVWEYFRASKSMKTLAELPKVDLQQTLLKRKAIVNDAVDGLMRELVLDQANGFMGKTCIHPSHLNFINGMLAVTREEYEDAYQILHTSWIRRRSCIPVQASLRRHELCIRILRHTEACRRPDVLLTVTCISLSDRLWFISG